MSPGPTPRSRKRFAVSVTRSCSSFQVRVQLRECGSESSWKLSAGRAEDAAAALDELGGHELAASLLRVHVEVAETAARHRAMITRFRTSHPGVPTAAVPAQPLDIHDLDGLRAIGSALGGR